MMLSFGYAIQHYVPNAETFKKLLLKVTADPHAALINASFPGIPVGEEFVIMSKKQLAKHLGVTDDKDLYGVHSGKFRARPTKSSVASKRTPSHRTGSISTVTRMSTLRSNSPTLTTKAG